MEDTSINPPELDESLVERLTDLAKRLDGIPDVDGAPLLKEFNELAGTNEQLINFQNVEAACEHDDHVRTLLIYERSPARPSMSKDEIASLITRLREDTGIDMSFETFVLATLEKTFPDKNVCDLIYWPNQYFGDNSPEQRDLSSIDIANELMS